MKNKTVIIFGDKFKIKYVPSVTFPGKEDGYFYRGLTTFDDRVIQIATLDAKGNPLDEKDMKYTLTHELIHAILGSGMYHEENTNEPLVELLAKCVVQLIDQKVI